MTIRIRRYKYSDREFILSLVKRFSEFELPEWRRREDVDQANRAFLEQSLKQPESDSAILIAEGEGGAPAGFVMSKSKRIILAVKSTVIFPIWLSIRILKVAGLDVCCSRLPKTGRGRMVIIS